MTIFTEISRTPVASVHAKAGVIHPHSVKSSSLEVKCSLEKRSEILSTFHKTFTLYETLFDTIKPEGFFKKADPLRHPLIFYYGHTATFYINKLILAKVLSSNERPDRRIEAMTSVGVDEMSWDDLQENHYDWPSVDEVRIYRKKVREIVSSVIEKLPLQDNTIINWGHPFWVILMGIEHERIHLETSTVLIRQLPLADLVLLPEVFIQCKEWQRNIAEVPDNKFVKISEGDVTLGRNTIEPPHIYGWDNEYGSHSAFIEAFDASEHLISNAQFYEFVMDGGYTKSEFWTEEGWKWVTFMKAEAPRFWVKNIEGKFVQRNVWDVTSSMPWDWPVECNYLEAVAFCKWYSKKFGIYVRLPTEDEYARLIQENLGSPLNMPDANIELRHYSSSCPVNKFRHGKLYDVIGNVWQWTETPMYPFDGFEVHPIYEDFTLPTFDARHNVMKGGSWISTGNVSNSCSRYQFRRHFYQNAGFRIAHSNVTSEKVSEINNSLLNPYESDELVAQYSEFHFGTNNRIQVENFCVQLARICQGITEGKSCRRVLDLGCAVGRSSFELAKFFPEVIGIDFSARFIDVAYRMANSGKLKFSIKTEGDLVEFREYTLKNLNIDQEMAKKVYFTQGDACNLRDSPNLFNFDLVLAANLIDRLYDPIKFLTTIHGRINIGGYLVLLSPYTWLESYTPKDKWIGGKMDKNGEHLSTINGLQDILSQNFHLAHAPFDVPFVIRETARKFQHTFSECSIWKRIS